MKHIIYFFVAFLLIYMIYYFASIRKAKKNKNKLPVEVQYLVLHYGIDIKKISYRNFLNTIAIVGSFDIALVATIVGLFKEFIWQLLFGFVFVIPIILISFMVVGKYYQKVQNSVMDKDEKKKVKKKEKKK